MYAADSSGIVGDRATNDSVLSDAIMKDGTKYTFLTPDTQGPIKIEDSNGNALDVVNSFSPDGRTETTTITDTAGRIFTIVSEYQYGYQPVSLSYVDQNGATQSINISYTQTAVSVASLCGLGGSVTTCEEQWPSSAYFPSTITLQDGSTYLLQMQPNSPAELASITLPTGGVISWTYGQTDVSGDKVLSRTVTANGQTAKWKYNYQIAAQQKNGASNIDTVTDPANNDTQYTCTIYGTNPLGVSSTAQLPPCYMTKEQVFSGSASGGNALVTKGTGYTITGVVMPTSTTVTWAATGKVSETDTSWDSIPNSGYYSGTDNPANDVSRGNVVSKIDYDYGSGSHGALIRNTQWSYLHQQNNAYVSPNIVDRPYQVSVYNSATMNSSTLVSQTTTSYDQFNQSGVNGQSGLVATTGTTNHDYANFSTSATIRGLPTSVSRYVGSSSNTVNTYTDYNDLGTPTISTDGRNNSKTYAYGNQNAFLASTTLPTVNGITQEIAENHDLNTGLLLSTTDLNNKTTTNYTYNALMRILTIQTPDGGTTINSYPDPNHVDTTVTQTPNPSRTSVVVLDGLGRVSQTELTSDPGGPVYVNKAYDGLGRVASVTNPFRSADPSHGTTSYTYDALSRKTLQTQPDTNVLQWCYNGIASNGQTNCLSNKSGVNLSDVWVDFSDEDGHHWQRSYDSGGRLTGVMEPLSTNVPGIETDYTYDALDDLLNVTQNSSGGESPHVRSFTYDGLGRLTSANNPETGSVCYGTVTSGKCSNNGYDANGNLVNKTDAIGNQTTQTFDALNRLTSQVYSTGDPTKTFIYDQAGTNTIGRLTYESSTAAGARLSVHAITAYDPMGRITAEAECTITTCGSGSAPNFPYNLAYTYDLAGNLETSNSGVAVNIAGTSKPITLTYSYDGAGHLETITSNWLDSHHPGTLFYAPSTTGAPAYSPFGGLLAANLSYSDTQSSAPQILLSRTYDVRGRSLTASYTTPSGQTLYSYNLGTLSNGKHGYDGVGNVTGFHDSLIGEWDFGYDSLNRLTSATGVSGSFNGITVSTASQGWTYDSFGNRTSQTAGSNQTPTEWATYGSANNRIVTNNLPGTVTYDAAGRLTNDGSKGYLWEAQGWLCGIAVPNGSGGTNYYQYIYDAEGRLVTTASRQDYQCYLNTTTLGDFVVDKDGHQVTEVNGSGQWQHTNVFANGELLATYTPTEVHFALGDWQGTKRVQTVSEGGVEQVCWNLPFNDAYGCSSYTYDATEHHYTGKEHDPYTQLDLFGARKYTNYSGRFLSPDFDSDSDEIEPVPYANLENPQTLNLYSYVRNNPLSLSDDTGHVPCGGSASVTITVTPDGSSMSQSADDCPTSVDLWSFQLQSGYRNFVNNWNQRIDAHAPPQQTSNTEQALQAVNNVMMGLVPAGGVRINDNVRKTLESIDQSGQAPPGHQGGREFMNDGRGGGQQLPSTDASGQPIKYQEWDVNAKQPGVNRGGDRLVTGSDGSAYTTSDHYQTFTRIR
jgi:RHS repeat-associated protein